jgi:hypothetical protein
VKERLGKIEWRHDRGETKTLVKRLPPHSSNKSITPLMLFLVGGGGRWYKWSSLNYWFGWLYVLLDVRRGISIR